MNMDRIIADKSVENVFDIEKMLSQLKAEIDEIDDIRGMKCKNKIIISMLYLWVWLVPLSPSNV